MAKICGAGLVAMLAVLLPGPTSACDNPVYRYALERWRPDDFLLVAPEFAPESLRQEIDALASRVPRVNLAVLDPAEAEQIGHRAEPDRLVLLAPPDKWQPGALEKVWSGPPTAAALARLADSPARQELARRLIAGEAIVWIVVDRGQAGDADGLKRLDPLIADSIRHVVATHEAREDESPPAASDEPDSKPIDKSAFWPPRMSVLRVRADDPQERVFVAILMASAEPEVAEVSAVFPVFGCGRTLGGMPLAKLDAKTLQTAADFLTGACSCEVKEMSPGSDLLLAADWSAVPGLIPRRDADEFAAVERGEEGVEDTAGSKATDPETTVNKPAAATAPTSTAPAAGRPTPPLAVWLAVAAGLLFCVAWLARASR